MDGPFEFHLRLQLGVRFRQHDEQALRMRTGNFRLTAIGRTNEVRRYLCELSVRMVRTGVVAAFVRAQILGTACLPFLHCSLRNFAGTSVALEL